MNGDCRLVIRMGSRMRFNHQADSRKEECTMELVVIRHGETQANAE